MTSTTVGSTTDMEDLHMQGDKYKVKIETTQKCCNISISASDNGSMDIASDIAIEGFLYTKARLESKGFQVSPLSNGAKE